MIHDVVYKVLHIFYKFVIVCYFSQGFIIDKTSDVYVVVGNYVITLCSMCWTVATDSLLSEQHKHVMFLSKVCTS